MSATWIEMPTLAGHSAGAAEFTKADFAEITDLLARTTGIQLNESKASLVYSRLIKRLRQAGLDTFSDYCEFVRADADERQAMIEALTTNTTSFFREGHHFEHLQKHVMPVLLSKARAGTRVRLWSCASSSGQEPYSLAMTVLSSSPDAGKLDIRILATDVNTQMVARGAEGVFDKDEFDGVPPALAAKYFHKAPGGRTGDVIADAALKRLVAFRVLNLLAPWPMKGLFDVIFCRNVMIYFSPETQAELWAKLAARLAPGGILYIGHSERISGPAANQFETVGVTTYRKRDEGQK
jgi:chemotaxis protein methyltransferase CheR